MYNTKVVCTYHTPEVFLETDNINEEDKEFIRDSLYRQELLDIFEMGEYDEAEMNKVIHELYERIKDCNELKECMAKVAGKYMVEDLEFGLMILFSYDYMYMTHICISEYLGFCSTFLKVDMQPKFKELIRLVNL